MINDSSCIHCQINLKQFKYIKPNLDKYIPLAAIGKGGGGGFTFTAKLLFTYDQLSLQGAMSGPRIVCCPPQEKNSLTKWNGHFWSNSTPKIVSRGAISAGFFFGFFLS